ncbi:unnamed protein product [Microthlaspi erraticum]|uniref:Uncharacterized protein n=1 Tax=Microthlaspi erraticum TaxID=1685480 RepID=A0A6D2KE19_9BRAS|nr:unnamed protein product [Microthlaspi erraticum]
MDFIKTSSLRALIELTFQRNWNGLIWMSRKGVTTKRVKTVQTALSRTAPKPRSPAGRETMFRARPNHIRPTEVSAKVPNRPADHAHDPGNIVPRSAKPTLTPHRARPKRASRETSLAAAQPFRVPRPMHPSEPGKNVPRPAENSHRPISIRSTTPADREYIRPRPFRLALFEAQTYVFKPGLTLSRL